MKFTPVNTFVVVKKVAGALESQGGIILTASTDTSDRCEVVAKSELVSFIEVGETLLIRWSQALKIDDIHFAVDAKDIVSKVS